MKNYQIAGLPEWARSPRGEQYDIVATAAEATLTTDRLQALLQTLLADRFQLKLHRELKELPVYALVIGKNGSKLKEVGAEERSSPPTNAARSTTIPTEMPAVSRSTIPMLMGLLSNSVDRPVTDHTGLTGSYEYPTLNWRQFGEERRSGTIDPDAGQSVFGAIQTQLGLKLEARKELTEILVIDRAERPSAN